MTPTYAESVNNVRSWWILRMCMQTLEKGGGTHTQKNMDGHFPVCLDVTIILID